MVCWAQHKASGDTIVKTNTLGANARTRFKGTARSWQRRGPKIRCWCDRYRGVNCTYEGELNGEPSNPKVFRPDDEIIID